MCATDTRVMRGAGPDRRRVPERVRSAFTCLASAATLALALYTALPLVAAPAAAQPRPPLGHAGRWITDADGRVVILHGVNMVYKVPPYAPDAIGFGTVPKWGFCDETPYANSCRFVFPARP